MKKLLFIDRDGTIIREPSIDKQVDSLEKLEFLPNVFKYLGKIVEELDYDLVMVTNQDGLGTKSFPEETFWPAQNKMLTTLKGEGIEFKEILIDKTFEKEKAPTRKPRTGLLQKYIYGNYNLKDSFVIGDRITDLQLAENLGCNGLMITDSFGWKNIYQELKGQCRTACVVRKTKETDIEINLNLDDSTQSNIETGLGFFDHMLEQIAKHAAIGLNIMVNGDLEVDEHHTIEDVGIALGQAFEQALGSKKGISRYGFLLPMDDCLAQVAVDFGGRSRLVWNTEFKREMVGKMPTEMFEHFFLSLADGANCNINIKAEGINEHHKIEAIFKGFAKAVRMAIKKEGTLLPTTKGML